MSYIKVAISAARALGALQARSAMGARVAPQTMQYLGTAAGQASTPASLRKAVLNAGDDVRMQGRMREFASQPQPMAARARSSEVIDLEQTNPRQMFDFRGPMTEKGDNMFFSSPLKRETLFGGGAQLHDPSNVMQAPTIPRPDPKASTQIADTVAQRGPAVAQAAGTVAARKPMRPKIAAASMAPGAWSQEHPTTLSTGDLGSTMGRSNEDPADAARSGFMSIAKMEDTVADSALPQDTSKTGGYKLAYKTKFRGLDISIENRKGSYRYWYDKGADKEGKTMMQYPYGYVLKSRGLDGDHVDVFFGPHKEAPDVYVVMTNKAPDFKERDEEKCFLGFESEDQVRKIFAEHYDKPGFFHSIITVPFETFKSRLGDTLTGKRSKIAAGTYVPKSEEMLTAPNPSDPKALFAPHGGPVGDLTSPLGVHEKPLGFPPSGPMRVSITPGMAQDDQIDRQFGYFDHPTDTTAIEGAGVQPDGLPLT
jgi:hypothetical protein